MATWVVITGDRRLPASATVAATDRPAANRRSVSFWGFGVLFPEKGSGKEEINAERTGSAGKRVPPTGSHGADGSGYSPAKAHLTGKDFLEIPDSKAISQEVPPALNERPV